MTSSWSISYIHVKLLLMPKQCGPIQITGTIDNVCFYKMDGIYFARMKSSLTRKRVLKSAAFRRTREHAATLGEASKIASRVYRLIPKAQRKHTLYREMTGKAIYLLREGKNKEVIFQNLSALYLKQDKLPEPAVSCTKNEVQDDRGYSGEQQPPAPMLQKTCSGLSAGRPTRAINKARDDREISGKRELPVPGLKKTYSGLLAGTPTRAINETRDNREISGKQELPIPRVQLTYSGLLAGTPTRAINIVVKGNKLKGMSRVGFSAPKLRERYTDAYSLLPNAGRRRKRFSSHGLGKRDKAMGP